MHDRTTTVLTIDLPGDLGERLRKALNRGAPDGSRRSMRALTIEALKEWLERDELRDKPEG